MEDAGIGVQVNVTEPSVFTETHFNFGAGKFAKLLLENKRFRKNKINMYFKYLIKTVFIFCKSSKSIGFLEFIQINLNNAKLLKRLLLTFINNVL